MTDPPTDGFAVANMGNSMSIPFPNGIAKIVERAELQDCEPWTRAFAEPSAPIRKMPRSVSELALVRDAE